jgi:hypothetical protein
MIKLSAGTFEIMSSGRYRTMTIVSKNGVHDQAEVKPALTFYKSYWFAWGYP